MIGAYFSICSLVFLIIFIIVFFSKKKIDNIDNQTYGVFLIVTLIGIVLDVATFIMYKTGVPHENIIYKTMAKLEFIYYFAWLIIYWYYMICTIYVNKKGNLSLEKIEKIKKIITYLIVICTVISVVLSCDFNVTEKTIVPVGPSVMFSTAIDSLMIFVILVTAIINFKYLFNKKFISLFILIFAMIFGITLQQIRPELFLLNFMITIVDIVLYFTIENPDVRMLNELYKNRELMEQGYEDKYNFLFEMTQEAKRPILDLNRLTSELRLEEDPKKIKEGMAIINNLTRQLDFSINNVLNISSFDIQKLKIVNTKYDVLKVCDGLSTTLRNEIKPGVTFNMELPKTVPTLYGDYMKLRQILYSLLNNASKNTDNGSVNLKLNIIEKYDFCRLIFNISDTGKGMSIEKINDILSATGELDKEEMEYLEKKEFNFKVCQKVVKIMGGNLMIKSTVGMGTEITLTLDQRVYHEKDTSILNQYEESVNRNKRVLIVAQNKELANYLKKKLNNNDITYSALAYGGDAVDRIKAGKNYDYILVEDDMKEMSGLATLQELQKLKNFDIPVIIMLNESKDSIKDHYIKDGFSDYLLTENLEEETKRIIEKY